MKKLLLLAASALLAGSAFADTWALVGSFTNWGDNPIQFTGTGDVLTCNVPKLTSGFKVVPIENGNINWNYQYSVKDSQTIIEEGETYTLTPRNNGDDLPNMELGDGIVSINDAVVSWNPSNAEFKITGTVVEGLPDLYVAGSFNNWIDPGKDGSVLMTENNGIYTATFDLGNSGDVEFKISGAGWSNQYAGSLTITKDEALVLIPVSDGANLKTTLTGTQTLTFNYNTKGITFGDPALTNNPVQPMDWRVVGAYTALLPDGKDWNFDLSTQLTENNGVYSGKIENLTSDFKIVNTAYDNWDFAYTTAQKIEIGKPYTLEIIPGDVNISFAIPVQSVKNATVTWNPETYSMTITAAESDIVKGYPVLYVVGGFALTDTGGWIAPGEEGTVKMNEVDGVYTAIVNLGDEEGVEFKLAGSGWSNQIAGGVAISYQPATVQEGGDNLWTELTGEQTLVFDYSAMEMYFVDPNAGSDDEGGNGGSTEEPGDGPTVGIDSINASNAPVMYFNLQGQRVINPQNGIYIRKQGNTTSKIILK